MMTLLTKIGGYEFWTHYDDTAGVYEVFLDADGQSYIGVCDDLQQAGRFVKDWAEERAANGG